MIGLLRCMMLAPSFFGAIFGELEPTTSEEGSIVGLENERTWSEVVSAVSMVEKLTNETRPTSLVSQPRVISY